MTFISRHYMDSLSEEALARLLASHTKVGYQPENEDKLLIPDKDRFSGTYVGGVQGVGKSGLIENFVAQDIAAKRAVAVIDPHGDLVDHCVAQLPKDKLAYTYILDMQDEAYPFGINVFAARQLNTSIAQAQSIDRVMHCFEVLWPEVLNQQHLPRYLRASTIALFANPGSTLVDMYRFLLDDMLRQRMLQSVTDPTVRQFWQTQYNDLSASARLQRVEPLIGRLESLFMGRSLVRNIVGQSQSTIDFRTAIENREIIFIKLPIKTLAQDARLIGTLLVAQLHAAIFSFADVPEHQRPGFSLYVDEFQHFATPDFAEMLSEGRKFGMRVTVAHQYRSQLPSYLQASTMTARTKVIFQVTPEDAREMAHLFPASEVGVKPQDIDPKPVEHLLSYGSDNPTVETLIDWYLRPLQMQKKSGTIEIMNPGFQAEHLSYQLLGVKPPTDKPKVADPTPYLNNLLYQVMKFGDATLPIPIEVIYGFANCGRGFFADFRYLRHKEQLLSSDVSFPPALVVETTNGSLRWTRPPENGLEQFYHFLFFLRAVMAHLANEPMGKKSTLSTTDVAHMLTQLPRRAAFVRSGEDIGVIYTEDTLPMVATAILRERLAIIQAQTRQKYCRPKDQVEGNTIRQTINEPKLSRWEEM